MKQKQEEEQAFDIKNVEEVILRKYEYHNINDFKKSFINLY